MRLLTIRSSALPLAFACAGSVRPAQVLIDTTDESAANGTATHEALEPVARGLGVPWEKLDAIAASHGADANTVKMLVACGAQLWEQVKDSFPDALTEVALTATMPGEVELTGHVDVFSIVGTVARLGDWKSGFKDSNYRAQMQGYCALALLDNRELTEATCTLLWVRDREVENYTMTRDDLRKWQAEFNQRLVEWDGKYRPGRHCLHCPRRHECEAATALSRTAVSSFLQSDVRALAEMPAADIIDVYHQAKIVKDLAERALNAIREHARANGPIVANGTRVHTRPQETIEVEPLQAWPVLEEFGFIDQDFAQCVKITTGAMKKVAAARAGRGKGAKAVAKLMTDLDVAGALRHGETVKLEERREV
jgi:hypothetical protein